jgi:AraC-like DNA-binding protein
MTRQLHQPVVIDARAREERLRFWRPVPLEAADVVCGEGAVGELPIHAHQALQVMLPASRFAVVDGRSAAVVVRPGQVHVAAPLELHGARSLDDVPCAMRILLVAPAMLTALGGVAPLPWRGVAPGGRQFVLDDQELYAQLWALTGELRGPLVALTCVPRLVDALVRMLGRLAARPAPAAIPRAGRQAGAVARVCDHLRAHVAESVSLDELAALAGLSKFHLLRSFRRVHGVTPHAYQMQLRLARAWQLIAQGHPLSRATYDAGFADQSHLTRRFGSQFGITPARYARQLAAPPGVAPAAAFGAEHEATPARERLLTA